jgi:hypothetical protein
MLVLWATHNPSSDVVPKPTYSMKAILPLGTTLGS